MKGCRLGIDSHADISCIGRHGRILEVVEGQSSTVHPFNDSYEPMKNIATVNAAIACDTEDGRTYIVHLNQCLDFTQSMEHSILCTNQARITGVKVNDVPRMIDHESSQSIEFPDDGIMLPLDMVGPVPYLAVRYPTDEDLETSPHLNLTSADSDWNPQDLEWKPHLSSITQSYQGDNLITRLQTEIRIRGIKRKKVSDKELSPEVLSSLWGININDAARTLRSTTQDSIRQLRGPLHRRVKTRAHHRSYNQLAGYLGAFASDTFKANVTSIRGNKYTQLFTNRGNFVRSYPMKTKADAHKTLDRFLHEVGIPHEILTDGGKELHLGEWGKTCSTYKIHQKLTEPYSPWQNPAELRGGIVKRKVRHMMRTSNTPIRLWDYCWEYVSEIVALTASDHIHLDGVTPFEKVKGFTPNIAELVQFAWYEWVWYYDPSDPDKIRLGRWLGPAHDVGQGMAYHILSDKAKVVTRSTIASVSSGDHASHELADRKAEYTKSVEETIGNHTRATVNHCDADIAPERVYETLFDPDRLDDEEIEPQEVNNDGTPYEIPDIDDYIGDKYLGLRVQLPKDGEMQEAKVTNRKRSADGTPIGTAHPNPIHDTRQYQVTFGDGSYADYSANVLTENLLSQVDDDGKSTALLSGIVGHRKNPEAIDLKDGWYDQGTVRKRKVTTKGWDLKVEWKDGTTSWIPLKLLKESNPIELAEYAVARSIHDEPAFAWWVPYTLKKRARIVSQVHARVTKHSMKFGVTVPSTVEEALKLDKETGTSHWKIAIEKELKNVRVAFQLLEDGEKVPVGSKLIPYHFVFTVKVDLTRKARLVAGGHRNRNVPAYATYSSVCSRESIRIAFLIAALNDLEILMADIGNAYLNAPCRERVYVKVGAELFGQEHEGKHAVIVRALYGLKSAGASWRHTLSNTITQELKYKSTIADPDVYMKPRVKANGEKYYAYIIVYVDDILSIDIKAQEALDRLGEIYRLKDRPEFPKMYLGTNVRRWQQQDTEGIMTPCYALGSESYVKESLRIVAELMHKYDLAQPGNRKSSRTPFTNCTYQPELESTDYCSPELHTVYQNLIGMLRWMCELGRVDILLETSLLSQYLAQPRVGHLNQALAIFQYLKKHDRSWLVCNPDRFDIDWVPKAEEPSPSRRADEMKKMYSDAVDEIPPNMPEPRGKAMDISVFVDADHAGNKVTRRSQTGVLLLCNSTPVNWYSKRQNTVETSTFGSEFIALRVAVEMIESLAYKLRMFGIPYEGPARVFCDNESVVKSSSFPESTLKKKHCSIAYHRIRESVVASKLLIYYEKSESNLADLFTKVLPHHRRDQLIKGILN